MTSPNGQEFAALRVEFLGPFRLIVDGEEVSVKRPQVQKLLALLACRPGRNTSADLMIEHLWSEEPPADPRAALRVVLTRTRSVLGDHADKLESTVTGQRLQADTDAEDFDALNGLVNGTEDPALAVELAEEALALWRGAPFADLDADELQPAIRRLEEAKWRLGIKLAHLYRGSEDYEALAALVGPMFSEEPHREDVALLYAFGLGRSGQTAEGLSVLQRCRASLRDDFGLGVSQQLADLEEDLLRGGVNLPTVLDGAVAQSEATCVVDREDVLRHIVGMAARPVVVRAEAGGGKTTLLRLVEKELADAGSLVMFANAKANPSRPLEAIAGLIESVVDRSAEPLSPELQDAVSRVLPDIFDAPATATPLTRTAMVDSIVRLLSGSEKREAQRTPEHEVPVFIIDDCQWLDRLSAEVVSRLAETDVRLILGTRTNLPNYLAFLDAEVDADTEADTNINTDTNTDRGADGAFANAERVELAPISHAGAVTLFEALAGREPADDLVEDLLRRSGGNPLFLELLIDLWLEGEGPGTDLPVSILVTVQQRLGTLSARARDTVQIASVFGEGFSLGLLRRLAPTADIDIEEAVRAGLVVSGESGAFGFRHSLLALGAYQLLSTGQRVVLHDEVGRLLEDDGGAAAEYAPHCAEAWSIDPERSSRAAIEAADEFALVFDWHRVLEQIEIASRAPRFRTASREEVQLNLAHGRALRALGKEGSDAALYVAADFARTLQDSDLLVEAVTELCTYGRTMEFGGLNEKLLSLLDEAVELDVSNARRAHLLASASTFLSFSEQHERARKLFHQSLELAGPSEDLEIEGFVLMHAHIGLGHPDDRGLLEEAACRLREIASGDADFLWEGAFLEFGLAADRADRQSLDRLIEELRSLTPHVQRRNRDFGMAFSETAYAILVGDLDTAEDHLMHSLAVGQRLFGESWTSTLHVISLVALRHAQGRLAEVLDVAHATLASRPNFATSQAVLAVTAAAADDRELCRANFELVRPNNFGSVIPDVGWKGVAILLADTIEYLEDAASAEVLYDQLVPYANTMAWAGMVAFGPMDSALEKLAATMGDSELAAKHHVAAEAVFAALQ